MPAQETRTLSLAHCGLRSTGKDDAPKIVGHAAVFDKWSNELGVYMPFREVIRKGAFAASLRSGPDPFALIDHDISKVLGRRLAGTLRIREDDVGLLAEIDPPDTTYARDLMESLRRGDVSGMSFRFDTIRDAWHEEKRVDGTIDVTRELFEVLIYEVSVVAAPAYPDTDVALRSLEAFRKGAAGTRVLEDLHRRLRLVSAD